MPNRTQVVHHTGDPQVGNLATPVNSSDIVKAFIGNLPAYRPGLSANRRGLEVGMAHGYLLLGPFTTLGPLRDSEHMFLAGLLSAVGLVVILTICLSLYSSVHTSPPLASVTVPKTPADLNNREGWNEFTSGFLIGGIGGAAFGYLLLANIPVLNNISSNLFN
jgi:photosystem I subunit 11